MFVTNTDMLLHQCGTNLSRIVAVSVVCNKLRVEVHILRNLINCNPIALFAAVNMTHSCAHYASVVVRVQV